MPDVIKDESTEFEDERSPPVSSMGKYRSCSYNEKGFERKSLVKKSLDNFKDKSSISRSLSSHELAPQSQSNSSNLSRNQDINSSALGTSIYFPIMIGVLPLVANNLFKGLLPFNEVCFVGMLTLWIYYILQTPWKLFFGSRKMNYGTSERFYIVMIFTSPMLSAYSVQIAKNLLGGESVVISGFSIPLFLCAAMLRPIIYFLTENCDDVVNNPIYNNNYSLENVIDRISVLESMISSMPKKIGNSNSSDFEQIRNIDTSLARLHVAPVLEKLSRRIDAVESLLELHPTKESRTSHSSVLSRIFELFTLPCRLILRIFGI